MKKIKISACYIVRDNAAELKLSLSMIKKFVDEIIVVDTGSKDQSVKVAKKFGAKVFFQDWQNDFSTPRNFALSKATGDWILFLDADEFFSKETAKNLRPAIEQVEQVKQNAIQVFLVNIDKDNRNKVKDTNFVVRIFKNNLNIHYVGKIHEELRQGEGLLQKCVTAPANVLTLYHTGYSASLTVAKAKRNLEMLLAELETTSEPQRIYCYLAECYSGVRDFENAKKYALLDIDSNGDKKIVSYRILLTISAGNNTPVEERKQFVERAIKDFPDMPEFTAELAECFAQQGNLDEAVETLKTALEKYKNYKGKIPTMFNDRLVAIAEKRMKNWEDEMRKIKPKNKKANDKNLTKLAELTQELIKEHTQTHDKEKIDKIAKQMFELEPPELVVAENTTAICVDNALVDTAEMGVNYMLKKFEPSPYVYFLRSRVYDLKRDYGNCIKYAEEALQLKGIKKMHEMMLHNILGHAYRYIGNAEKSVEHYEIDAKMNLEGVTDPGELATCQKIRREDLSNLLFSLHNVNVSREKLFEEILSYNKLHQYEVPYDHFYKTHPRHEKIRLGYVSPDIRRHVVAFFSYAFFLSYDKSKFEVYIYARNGEDNVTKFFEQNVDHYTNIRFDTVPVAAEKIKNDEIDILIDLSGHTANNCLETLAYKPAPIQISGIGWFNTTGFKPVDYFIVDKFTDPVGLNEKFFTEKMLRLQHSHFCYMWHDAPEPISPAPCTKKGFVTFVSFNMFTKVTDEMMRIWAKIMKAVPSARFLVKSKSFRDEYGTNYVLERLKAADFPIDRLDYEQDEPKYLHRYNDTDIALDTFPYPGGGTTCDALYMGVPVITLVGDRHNSRFGYSLLHNMGLDELCAFNEEEYIKIAVDLANDWDRIRDYHLTLRRRMQTSPIMDDIIYMAEVEAAYEKIYNAWINGEELPDFPQDAPEVTPELSEEFYNRAQNYLALNIQNKNQINTKRALYYFEQAAQCNTTPRAAEIYLHLSDCQQELLDFANAYESIKKCGEILEKTDATQEFFVEYLSRRGKLARMNGQPLDSAESYNKAAQLAQGDKKFELTSAALSGMNYLEIPSEDVAEAHFEYQNLLENIQPYTEYHQRGEKIKVGYLSANFKWTENFTTLLGIISCHDKEKFEVVCYNLTKNADNYTKIFKNNVENFVEVQNLSAAELAEKIHADNIDVLVDFTGHGEENKLPVFAYKPAPVQISGICYAATTGLKSIDYFITDKTIDLKGENEKYFAEKLLYLPSQFCYAQRSDAPVSEGAPCIKNKFVTFATVCSYSKMNDEILNIWRMILEKVPTAKLTMRAPEFSGITTVLQLYYRMKKIGFNMDQINFEPEEGDQMIEMKKFDLILDTYPCVSTGGTLNALYMGTPVLTMYGKRRNTRFGLSILQQVGAEDLAVDSVEKYIERAVAIANDTETLDVLHKNLRQMVANAQNLGTINYTRMLEGAYKQILDNL